MMDSIVSAQSHISDGKIRALAVSGVQRSNSLPAVPTFEELDIKNMQISNWFGVFAPAGTPVPLVAKLNQEFNRLTQSPDFVERFNKLGAQVHQASSEIFAKLYRDESEGWKALIARAGIKADNP